MPADPAGRGRLRASHMDREHVVGMLKAAFVQGRLTMDEFVARVDQALTARTYADLAVLTADLPAGLIAAAPPRRPARAPARPPRRKVAKRGVPWATAIAALGLLVGIASAELNPPTFTSNATIMTFARHSSTYSPVTQVAMVRSAPVMAGALHRLGSGGSLEALRGRVQVKSLTPIVLSVSVQGDSATQAERAADAVADSYIAYVDSIAPGRESAQVLDPPVRASETSRSARLFVSGGLGALLGALIGVIGTQAFRRSRRRFTDPVRRQIPRR